jgi:hypothetical protein
MLWFVRPVGGTGCLCSRGLPALEYGERGWTVRRRVVQALGRVECVKRGSSSVCVRLSSRILSSRDGVAVGG